MTEEGQPDQPGYYLMGRLPERQNRAVDYSLTAAHGWEFLLDNHLETESERRKSLRHAVVLGEN
jgi:hypothetical protein